MKTIVLGYDDTESSMRALRRVVELCKSFRCFRRRGQRRTRTRARGAWDWSHRSDGSA